MTWQDQSACKGQPLEWFFFSDIRSEVVFPQVAELCASCPARFDCLNFAITTTGMVGIWAGTTTAERMKLRRENRATGCGTNNGYQRHRYRREPVCEACRAAHRAHKARTRGGYVFGARAN